MPGPDAPHFHKTLAVLGNGYNNSDIKSENDTIKYIAIVAKKLDSQKKRLSNEFETITCERSMLSSHCKYSTVINLVNKNKLVA